MQKAEFERSVRDVEQKAWELLRSYEMNTRYRPGDHDLRWVMHPNMWNRLLASGQPSIKYSDERYTESPKRMFMGLETVLSHTIGVGEVMFVMGSGHPALMVHPVR